MITYTVMFVLDAIQKVVEVVATNHLDAVKAVGVPWCDVFDVRGVPNPDYYGQAIWSLNKARGCRKENAEYQKALDLQAAYSHSANPHYNGFLRAAPLSTLEQQQAERTAGESRRFLRSKVKVFHARRAAMARGNK